MINIGRRICVYGPTGSGKTILSRQISERIGVPHIELDAIFWKPDWVQSSLEEFRSNVTAAIDKCSDGWVCDGNYSRARDLILPQADTVVWLRPPFRIAFWRLLKRTVARARDKTLLWGTNRESLMQNFLSRDSLILYQVIRWRKYGKIGKNLEEIPHRARLIELRSQKETDAFLRVLGNSAR